MEGCTECPRARRSPGEGVLLEHKSHLRAECAPKSWMKEVLKRGGALRCQHCPAVNKMQTENLSPDLAMRGPDHFALDRPSPRIDDQGIMLRKAWKRRRGAGRKAEAFLLFLKEGCVGKGWTSLGAV